MGSEIDERKRRGIAERTRWPVLLLLALALSTAVGCADNGASSDSYRRGGFYGGISSGGVLP
jgi:hypothetical protein